MLRFTETLRVQFGRSAQFFNQSRYRSGSRAGLQEAEWCLCVKSYAYNQNGLSKKNDCSLQSVNEVYWELPGMSTCHTHFPASATSQTAYCMIVRVQYRLMFCSPILHEYIAELTYSVHVVYMYIVNSHTLHKQSINRQNTSRRSMSKLQTHHRYTQAVAPQLNSNHTHPPIHTTRLPSLHAEVNHREHPPTVANDPSPRCPTRVNSPTERLIVSALQFRSSAKKNSFWLPQR